MDFNTKSNYYSLVLYLNKEVEQMVFFLNKKAHA